MSNKVLVFIFSLVFSCFSTVIFAQFTEYETFINKAEQSVANKELALAYYDSAFVVIDFIPFHYFDAFEVAFEVDKLEKAFDYLCLGTSCGLETSIYTTPMLSKFKKTDFYKTFLLKKDSLIELYEKSIDTEYLNELKQLRIADQANRTGDAESLLTDSLNFEKLQILVVNKGFPTFRKVGLGFNIAYLLLWHHRDEYPDSNQWKTIMPSIKQEIAKGEISSKFFLRFNEEYKNHLKSKH